MALPRPRIIAGAARETTRREPKTAKARRRENGVISGVKIKCGSGNESYGEKAAKKTLLSANHQQCI